MSRPKHLWRLRLTGAAEADVERIIRWTGERFGRPQAEAYKEVLAGAFGTLMEGPRHPSVRVRDDIRPGLHTLHVGRRRGRHFILFRVSDDQDDPSIEILRVLHDAMDLPRHLPEPKAE